MEWNNFAVYNFVMNLFLMTSSYIHRKYFRWHLKMQTQMDTMSSRNNLSLFSQKGTTLHTHIYILAVSTCKHQLKMFAMHCHDTSYCLIRNSMREAIWSTLNRSHTHSFSHLVLQSFSSCFYGENFFFTAWNMLIAPKLIRFGSFFLLFLFGQSTK